MRVRCLWGRLHFIFLALVFFPSLAFATTLAPFSLDEIEKLCESSKKIHDPENIVNTCVNNREFLHSVFVRLPLIESDVSAMIRGQQLDIDAVDIDRGGQCELANHYQRISSTINRQEEKFTGFESNVLKSNLEKVQKGIAALKETILPPLHEFSQCQSCLERAKGDRSRCNSLCTDQIQSYEAIYQKIFHARKSEHKTVKERVMLAIEEQSRLKEDWDMALKESQRMRAHFKAQADLAIRERTKIHTQYRCANGPQGPIPAPLPGRTNTLPTAPGSTDSLPGQESEMFSPHTQTPPETGISTNEDSPFHGAITGALQTVQNPEKIDSVEQRVRQATMFIAQDSRNEVMSTGFYVKTVGPDGQESFRFVTSHHSVESNFQDPFGSKDNRTINIREANLIPYTEEGFEVNQYGHEAVGSANFSMSPGQYDRGNDIVMANAPPGVALEVAREGTLPEPGQEFLLSGHPFQQGAAVHSQIKCTFVGYTPNLHYNDMAYLLDCPGRVTHQGGLSGGPMVDPKTGQAFGVVSAHGLNERGEIIPDRIRVSPIYQDAQGRLVSKPQAQFSTNNCYNHSGSTAKAQTCSILPGMQFYTGP